MTESQELKGRSKWDLREDREYRNSLIYENRGYVISKGSGSHIKVIKNILTDLLKDYKGINQNISTLEEIHKYIFANASNDLRLYLMSSINEDIKIHREYFNAAKEIIYDLCGNELAMQKRIGMSLNLPKNAGDALPIHADTWNGVSPYELNIWIPLVDCKRSLCLYILERKAYEKSKKESKGLFKLGSEELFKELEKDLTYIEIDYGDILAFDQSLPHGYIVNKEDTTHWSLNCRFKSIHSPYWDKKLGEYFMPITLKTCSRLGARYKHPYSWLSE